MIWVILPIIFLCWGSFLNVVAYRLVAAQNFVTGRSCCPQCRHTLAWYDLIPVFSWIMLFGLCRYCKQPISLIYPSMELLTACLLTAVWYVLPRLYFPAYFIFISALLVTVSSDLQTMLISRFVTVFLIPVGILASACHLLPISLSDSLAGTLMGSLFLWCMAKLFMLWRNKEGIGQGDIDLLAFIGAFLGVIGSWFALCIAACTAALVGILYITINRLPIGKVRIPFGPFLALGAIMVLFFYHDLMYYFLLC